MTSSLTVVNATGLGKELSSASLTDEVVQQLIDDGIILVNVSGFIDKLRKNEKIVHVNSNKAGEGDRSALFSKRKRYLVNADAFRPKAVFSIYLYMVFLQFGFECFS